MESKRLKERAECERFQANSKRSSQKCLFKSASSPLALAMDASKRRFPGVSSTQPGPARCGIPNITLDCGRLKQD